MASLCSSQIVSIPGTSNSRLVCNRPTRLVSPVVLAPCVRCQAQASSEDRNSGNATTSGRSAFSGLSRRNTLTALLALAALSLKPSNAVAGEAGTNAADVAVGAAGSALRAGAGKVPTPIYFGNGCFWGRQKEFVDVEKAMGRPASNISAIVGYAGGRGGTGPDGKVCYYYGPAETVYEKLGHAEVVQLELGGSPNDSATQEEMQRFADAYFKQFRKTPFGMIRLDPQDAGPGYRNVVGIPGGVSSPLFKVLEERNVNGMKLLEGTGNRFLPTGPAEGDLINTVWVLDSEKFPFFRAEEYHQFHNGIGAAFPQEYRKNLKAIAEKNGRIGPTGCPEFGFM